MANIILALLVLLALGAVLWKAHQLGCGDTWLGLKRYFDLNYQTDEDENEDIEHGIFLLVQRLDDYSPTGWTIELQQAAPGRPPTVRLVSNSPRRAGVYNYDSPGELLANWSLPPTKKGN